jgi:hypothetical protein
MICHETEVDQSFWEREITVITQSLQAERHLPFSPKESPAGNELGDGVLQKEELGCALYDIMDVFMATGFRV